MAVHQDLEADVQESVQRLTLGEKFADGLSAVPPILGCTAATYLLGFSGCVPEVSEALPNGLNLSYHLAAGSGLYGGYTSEATRKIASLVTLVASFIPEAVILVQDGDLKRVGTAAGAKVVGYGIGYIVGSFFSN